MLEVPILRPQTPPESTLTVRQRSAPEDSRSAEVPKWWDQSALWLANENGNEISKICRAAKALLSEYATLLRPALRGGLLAQTDVVFDPEDWDEDDTLPSLDSFRCMLKGLIELAPVSRPYLSISDNGHSIAGWFDDRSRTVFEFLPNDRIRWVISRTDEGETDRAGGISQISKIREIARTHDALTEAA